MLSWLLFIVTQVLWTEKSILPASHSGKGLMPPFVTEKDAPAALITITAINQKNVLPYDTVPEDDQHLQNDL